jgi:trehalose 6-phosphate synthase
MPLPEDISIVLVSNRGPVSFVESENGFDIKRGAGGLAGALDPVARRLGDRAVWVAAATSETDRKAIASGAADDLASQLGYRMRLLDLEPSVYSDYYDIVSNRMLWFAHHCLWDELGIKDFEEEHVAAWERAYEPVNARFAQTVLEIGASDSLVLFQDYHLSTAPGDLRRARPTQMIFHFTHSSFCGPEGLDRLPSPIPRAVVEGMLGANLLGFHVPAWCEGFMKSCRQIGYRVDEAAGFVEHDDRRTWVRAYPIPIDAQELRKRAAGKEARRWADHLTKQARGPLLVRADRTEPSKNIVRGFEAFSRLLDRRSDLAGSARFVACLYPSRQTMPEYRAHTTEVERTVHEINQRHPDSIQLFMEDDYDRTLGALTVYDVLLVNSIMDGMNLVSKEGPAVNEASGVIVLSKGAGSFMELGDQTVTIADALDVEETAGALEEAFDMTPSSRSARANELRRRVTKSRPEDWIESQIEDLIAIKSDGEPASGAPRSDR